MKTPENIKQPTALQRIETLEGVLSQTIDACQMIVKENAGLKAQVLELATHLKAIINVQGIQAAVNEDIVKQNVADLEGRITKLLEKKEIEACESIGPESFVVAKEFNKEGIELDPRNQFAMATIGDEELKLALIGKVVGDTIEYKNSVVKIMEIYKAVQE